MARLAGPADDVNRIAERWLAELSDAIRLQAPERITALFREDGSWRDILALTGDIRSFSGTSGLTSIAHRCVRTVTPGSVKIRPDWPPAVVSRAGRKVIEVLFGFETAVGSGDGVVRLVPESDSARAWTFMLSLRSLRQVPEQVGAHRLRDTDFAGHFGAPNWLDKRLEDQRYANREPTVLIVGAGQAGLSLAARLGALGIDTLVVERTMRIGDNWRNRYHSLTLHNEIDANHLPYMPFPDTWPTYIAKDKMAAWLEFYSDAMEINTWPSTTFSGAQYDEAGRRWAARVTDGKGFSRTLHPGHIVIATGVSGAPIIPEILGLGGFHGHVLHSSEFTDASAYAGQKAVVFGVSNSGSDIAQDLHARGCDVAMVQRGSITVVSQDPGSLVQYWLYQQGYPLELCDLINIANPFPAAYEAHRWITAAVRELDRDLIAGLNSIGFRTDYGDEDTGFGLKYLKTGGGHYLNVGCSELLIGKRIRLIQYDDMDSVAGEGLRMRDGELIEANLIVLATGYHNLSAQLPDYFGAEVAARVGPVWGLDDEGELRNMWRPTPQPGLWFLAGGLQHCRMFSRFLALQIAAADRGIKLGGTAAGAQGTAEAIRTGPDRG
jgi:hypothetical protein